MKCRSSSRFQNASLFNYSLSIIHSLSASVGLLTARGVAGLSSGNTDRLTLTDNVSSSTRDIQTSTGTGFWFGLQPVGVSSKAFLSVCLSVSHCPALLLLVQPTLLSALHLGSYLGLGIWMTQEIRRMGRIIFQYVSVNTTVGAGQK